MTKNDVLDFCDKGNHKYREVDVLRSLREVSMDGVPTGAMYILFQCDVCPSKWVKRI